MQFERVNPGDLITANLMNRMLYAIEDLQTKVEALVRETAATAPVIIDVTPSRNVRLSQDISIIGRNFADPADHNDVTLGGVPISRFAPGSGPTRLNVTVPDVIPGIPGPATLVVRNGDRSDALTLQVAEARQIPRGRIVITETTPQLGQITVGGTFTYSFAIESQTVIPETYSFAANYSSVVGTSAAAWQSATTLLGADGGPLPASVSIRPTQPFTVLIRVRVPAGATSANLALVVTSQNNNAELSRSSSPVRIEVGATPVVNDPRTTIVLAKIGAASKAHAAKIDNVDGVEFPYSDPDLLLVKADMTFTVDGTYAYTAAIEPDIGPWILQPATPPSSPETNGSSQAVGVQLRLNAPDAGATHPERRTLVIRARHTAPDFESFIRIPIQGYVRA